MLHVEAGQRIRGRLEISPDQSTESSGGQFGSVRVHNDEASTGFEIDREIPPEILRASLMMQGVAICGPFKTQKGP